MTGKRTREQAFVSIGLERQWMFLINISVSEEITLKEDYVSLVLYVMKIKIQCKRYISL